MARDITPDDPIGVFLCRIVQECPPIGEIATAAWFNDVLMRHGYQTRATDGCPVSVVMDLVHGEVHRKHGEPCLLCGVVEKMDA